VTVASNCDTRQSAPPQGMWCSPWNLALVFYCYLLVSHMLGRLHPVVGPPPHTVQSLCHNVHCGSVTVRSHCDRAQGSLLC